MKKFHITLMTSIGAGLEYYDFVIYAMLATYISKNFFPANNPYVGLIETFAVFAIGYLMRPVGGVIFGIIGDRYGRKITFTSSIILMAAATFIMGIIPSFSNIGITATIIFTFMRLLQGLSYGAEMPGALTFLSEHIGDSNRGSHCGFMIMCVGLSTSLASFVLYILTTFLTHGQILNYGWRIPFILGSLLGVIGFFIRKKISETPHFQNQTNHPKFSIIELFRNHFPKLISALGIMLFPACFVVFFLYIPALLKETTDFTMSTISLVVTLGYVWSTVLIPIFGWLSDKVTRKKLMLTSTVIFMLLGIPLFYLLRNSTLTSLILFIIGYHTVIAAMAGCYFAMLPEIFPTSIRFTGVALAYNLAFLIAAVIPILANVIMIKFNNILILAILLIIISLLTTIALLTLKSEHSNKLS
jgi:MFS family permease